jgi:nucleoside-diphosphate-sugar epimerase
LIFAYRSNSTCLYTCAIRPAAVYGPGEEHHLQRILSLAKFGFAFFKIGGPNVKTDWVYADNLVLALILASIGLVDDIPGRKGTPIAAGQAYFICDGNSC